MLADTLTGADFSIGATTGSPSLLAEGSANTIAPVPQSSPSPTESSCAEAISRNGTYVADGITRGNRFCMQTDEGRIAYLHVLSAPSGARSVTKFEVTVWDAP
ncbi:hypothetical protein [Streptomyces sp. NPDC056524]|uniref:hypothetical protein n=1 Tax=Streptomyces sp. NPDC056524 TaxID=3345851 RepID=UPI0036960777